MSDTAGLLRFYEGWPQYQRWLVESVASLNEEELAYVLAPNQRPAWLIVAHIIGTRLYWFHIVLGVGDESIEKYDSWDMDGARQRSAAELVDGLEATWEMIREALAGWTPDDLDAKFVQSDAPEYFDTRGWIIYHMLEHDVHHGGEYFMTIGTQGLPTPDM
jgi:uncharacterized damage-inducible protein DinB